MIVLGGMIGVGKTSAAKILSEYFNSPVFFENVDNNPFLEKFYTSTDDEKKKYRYPFLLQLFFLNSRFKAIKDAMINPDSVLDRSIYEDKYFAYLNYVLGDISKEEWDIYCDLANNMLEEISGTPKKRPDLFIYLKADWPVIKDRISKRGRDYENEAQLSYFKKLYDGYDKWLYSNYKASPILTIDLTNIDLSTKKGKKEFIDDVLPAYNHIRNIKIIE